MEGELVDRAGIPFIGIPGGGLHGVGVTRVLRNGWDLLRAFFAAQKHLRQEQPAALLTTGGYISGPVAAAARLHYTPILVFVPDIEPAQSVKAIARLAARVAVSVPASLRYFAERKAVVTGYPLGRRITGWTRQAGREALGLDPQVPLLLVFGGSRGARSINRALLERVEALTALAEVLHVTGTLDWPEVAAAREALPAGVRARYHIHPYLHDRMGAALAAADLAVSRAGAGVLGEFPHFGLPAILVPYPYAWRYQRVNADWLAHRGAAVVVEDGELSAEMVPAVAALLEDEARRRQMAEAARAVARPDAAQRIAKLLLTLGQGDMPAPGPAAEGG